MKIEVSYEVKVKSNQLTLIEMGVVSFLEKCNNRGILDVKEQFPEVDEELVIRVLAVLKEKKILTYKATFEEDVLCKVLDYKVEKKVIEIDARILKTFKITLEQYQNIISGDDSKEKIIYTLFHKYSKELTKKKFQINNEREYKEYVASVTPLEVLQINNKILNIGDFTKIYDFIINYNFDLEVFSFVYDYAITTSIYSNINYEYISKIFMSLSNNKIDNLDGSYSFIMSTREKIENQYNKYIEPTYDEVIVTEEFKEANAEELFKDTFEEELDIEDLFEENEPKEEELEVEDLFGDLDFE
ncbi:MAG: hypothetical protein ACK5K7_02260 [Bacilli bacterium]